MNSHFDWMIDNIPLRIAMIVAGFTVWFAALYGTMHLAATV